MQGTQEQQEKLSQQLNQAGASGLRGLLVAINELSKLNLRKPKKSIKVSRTNSTEAAMDSGFKITNTNSQHPDINLEQQANKSVEQLNKSLANQKKFNCDIEVNGTKYTVDKYPGGGLSIESKDAKLFAKQVNFFGKQGKLDFSGDREKLIKDLPDIVARVDRDLDLDYPKQINNQTEVLYGYDSNNKFIDNKLSQKDAQAVLDLMDAKEGTTIAGGENLLIEHNGKRLFETDAQGVVTFSAYDRDPELLSSVKLKDEKGLTELKNYAKRIAATPDNNKAKLTKTDEVLVPDPPQEAQKVEPQSPIGKTLDRAEPTTEVDLQQTASVTYDQVLKSELATANPNDRIQPEIDGVKFNINPETSKGTRSVSVIPSEGTQPVSIGKIGKDGKFKPNPQLRDPKAIQAMERVLVSRGIEPQPVKESQQIEVAAQSKDPQYLPLTQENAPRPIPNLNNNSPQVGQSSPEVSSSPANAQTVTLPTQGGNAPTTSRPLPPPPPLPTQGGNAPTTILNRGENSPQTEQTSLGADPAPNNAEGVTLPTQGQTGVTLPTQGGNSERSSPEAEVSSPELEESPSR